MVTAVTVTTLACVYAQGSGEKEPGRKGAKACLSTPSPIPEQAFEQTQTAVYLYTD